MRCTLILLTTLCLLVPASAQSLNLGGGRGTLRILDGSVQVHTQRGNSLTIPTVSGAHQGLNLSGANRVPDDLVVTRGASGEFQVNSRGTGETAVIDMRPGGLTQVQSSRGSYSVPTDMVRAYLGGEDKEAARFFQILGGE